MRAVGPIWAAPLTTRVGGAILMSVMIASALVPLLVTHDVNAGIATPLIPPTPAHPFGTDNLGRDVFIRTFAAGQLDIMTALIGVGIPLIVGTLVGALAGTTEVRLVRGFIGLVIDGVNAVPFLVLALAVIAVVGTGIVGILVAIAVSQWARYAKLARTKASVIREADFVNALKVLGYPRSRIIVRHVLPNIFRESVAYGISDFTFVILTVASLSFLGAGIRPPTPEWGSMIADGRLYLETAPWVLVGPGLVLTLTGFAASLIGEGRRDLLSG